MNEYKVHFDPAALDALDDSARRIMRQSGSEAAQEWLERFGESVDQLKSHPRAFPIVSRRRGRTIRSKLILSHRVFYFVDTKERIVYVIDVVHTARESRLGDYRDSS